MTSPQHQPTIGATPGLPTGRARSEGLRPADLELAAVTDHGWRLTDRRRPLHDPFRLLAFIEHRGDEFEVMQIGAGFEWHTFDSLRDALAFIVETAPGMARERLSGGPLAAWSTRPR